MKAWSGCASSRICKNRMMCLMTNQSDRTRSNNMRNRYRMKSAMLATIFLTMIVGYAPIAAGTDTVWDASAHGIVGDGSTVNTAAIQAAIDSIRSSGGGVLSLPAGNYVTGTIQLKD